MERNLTCFGDSRFPVLRCGIPALYRCLNQYVALGSFMSDRTDRIAVSITIQHIQEQLCNAHLTALAATAGINLCLGTTANDYGVDGSFRSVTIDQRAGGQRRRETGFGIDFQAKASIAWTLDGSEIVYDLESNAYNDLVKRSDAAATFILVLLCLPRSSDDWHQVLPEQTIFKNACYWLRLDGHTTDNTATKRIRFPLENRLTPESLATLLAEDQAQREAMFI